MTLNDLKAHGDPADLCLLRPEEYTVLWASNFWDGMLSGILSYGGGEYWFEMFLENEDDNSLDQWYRCYAVVALSDDQLAREHEMYRDAMAHLGVHPNLHPKSEWHLFYDKHLEYIRSRPYGENQVVAWFKT